MNIKKIRFRLYGDGPVKITLGVKGEKNITASDIKLPADLEIINNDQHIATITDKKTTLEIEMEVEKGVGYVPVEQRQKEKLGIGVIAIDAIFSPVKIVNFTVENVRVGQRIDFNKILMDVETDGSISPETAMRNASEILVNHFKLIWDSIEDKELKEKKKPDSKEEKKEKKTAKKKSK